jgi:hypothetical protein
MKRLRVALPFIALLAGWLFLAGRAEAQPGISINRPPGVAGPPVSPYLNLLRQGSPAGVNYYDLVRPQFQFQNSIQALQGQVTTLGSQVAAETQGATGLPVTGHPVQFFNYSHYFPGRQGQGSVGRAPATTAAPPTGTGTTRR